MAEAALARHKTPVAVPPAFHSHLVPVDSRHKISMSMPPLPMLTNSKAKLLSGLHLRCHNEPSRLSKTDPSSTLHIDADPAAETGVNPVAVSDNADADFGFAVGFDEVRKYWAKMACQIGVVQDLEEAYPADFEKMKGRNLQPRCYCCFLRIPRIAVQSDCWRRIQEPE